MRTAVGAALGGDGSKAEAYAHGMDYWLAGLIGAGAGLIVGATFAWWRKRRLAGAQGKGNEPDETQG